MKMRNLTLVLLLAFLVCLNCTDEQAQGVVSKPASKISGLALMPVHTNIVFYTNFENLKQTPFGNELRAKFEDHVNLEEDDADYRDFVEKTGFDWNRNMQEMWISTIAVQEGKSQGGAIVQAKFNKDRILDYLRTEHRHKFEKDSYKGFDIYVSNDHDENALAFLNSETVAVGKQQWLEMVLDQKKSSRKNVLNNAEMTELVNRVPENSQIWGVFNLEKITDEWAEHIRKSGSHFKGSKSLENIESLIFYSQVGQKANTTVEGNFSTNEQAQLLADMLNGFKAMAKLAVMDDREAIDMLNEIKINVEGERLKINANLDQAFFDKLEKNKKKFGSKNLDWM
ncbi:MAG: hypothetical protein ACE5HO_03995 [bacterium]